MLHNTQIGTYIGKKDPLMINNQLNGLDLEILIGFN